MIGEMLDQVGKRTVFFRLHDVVIGRDERLALASGAQKDDGNVRCDSAQELNQCHGLTFRDGMADDDGFKLSVDDGKDGLFRSHRCDIALAEQAGETISCSRLVEGNVQYQRLHKNIYMREQLANESVKVCQHC